MTGSSERLAAGSKAINSLTGSLPKANPSRLGRLHHWLLPLLVLAIFSGAIWLINDQLSRYSFADIRTAVSDMSKYKLLLAVFITALSYASLITYDGLALLYLRKKVRPLKVALVSFVAYVCNYNLGLAGIGGTAVRVRYYSNDGLNGWDIARLLSFCAMSYWAGLFALAGIVLIANGVTLPETLGGQQLGLGTGLALLILPTAYMVLLALRDEPISIWKYTLELPSVRIGFAQLGVSAMDNLIAAAVLWALLPDIGLGYFGVLAIFMVAVVIGMVSHVPGGIGVFEAVVLGLMPPEVERTSLIASLLLFRVIYNLLPLVTAAIMVMVYELRQRRQMLSDAADAITETVNEHFPSIMPRLLAIITFASGAVLLFSGATPIERGRLDMLDSILPLPLLETSHFLNSLIGVLLLFVARGIQRRLNSAWYLAVGLLAAGSLLSLLKGLDWEEAITLGAILLLMLPCKSYFYRRSSLLHQSLSASWLVAIGITLLGSFWLGFFAFREVMYTDQLWWKFALTSDAPRFLRAAAGVGLLLVLFGGLRLLRGSSLPNSHQMTTEERQRARAIITASGNSSAALALTGDKRLLFSESGQSFLMYSTIGRTWVAMGNPVGLTSEREALIWKFRNLCDLYDGRSCFYQISDDGLEAYLECGLSMVKLGEEARVHLPEFSLQGSDRSDFRNRLRRAEKDGLTWEIIAAVDVHTVLPSLKAVSDQWLASQEAREKGFSVGYFDERYLREFPIAVVRQNNAIVAFANLWPGNGSNELSIDLMRYGNNAPKGVMEYLFLELIQYGQQVGYEWFNLGMAPLSGIESDHNTPVWQRLAKSMYANGEKLYGFRGLRAWKNKFDPVWQPRYLATRGGLTLPIVLTDVTRLISFREPTKAPQPAPPVD